MMNPTEIYPFKVGTLNCLAINDGNDVVPVENIIKDVPAELLQHALQGISASSTSLPQYFNCLYIRTEQQQVLVDAGWGQGTQRRNGALLDRLQQAGISPTEIDTLIITHGDIDHVGGIVTADGQLTFPNARYILLQEAWDFWSNEALVAKWPEPATVFGRKILPLIRDRIQVVASQVEFLPGFQLLPASGHRPGHTVVAIASAGQHLLHLADAVGHLLLLEHPTWTFTFDYRPEQALKDKERLLNQALTQQALIFGSHLPFPGVGHITPHKEGWQWQPLC